MEFEEQVVDSLAQWEMNWTTVTIQSKGSIIKKTSTKAVVDLYENQTYI